VRFGKYTPMRSKDKKVQIFVNGKQQQQQLPEHASRDK
jgi:phosphatidate phosphatase PAH1